MISDNSLFLWKVYSIMPFLGHFLNSLNASRIANSSVEFHLRLEEVAEETELVGLFSENNSSVSPNMMSTTAFSTVTGVSMVSVKLRFLLKTIAPPSAALFRLSIM